MSSEGLCYNSQLSTGVDPSRHGVLGVIGVNGVADLAHNDLRILKIPRNMVMLSFPEEF
jgi:predicted RecB family nuclease